MKIPQKIYEELTAGSDELKRWVSQTDSKRALKFKEEVDIELVRRVVEEGYAPDLSEDELEKIGKDPFLVAYALVDPNNRVIVTAERSKPRAERSNRKFPMCASNSKFVLAVLQHLAGNSISELIGTKTQGYLRNDNAI